MYNLYQLWIQVFAIHVCNPFTWNNVKVDLNALHEEFRLVITLLPVVQAINCGGHPLFADCDPKYTAALEEAQLPRDRLLNVITALLVGNHEIVAAVVNQSYKVLAVTQPPNNVSKKGSDTEDGSDSDVSEAHSNAGGSQPPNQKPPGIFAIRNPCSTDTYTFTDDYLLAQKGKSHRETSFGAWKDLFDIK